MTTGHRYIRWRRIRVVSIESIGGWGNRARCNRTADNSIDLCNESVVEVANGIAVKLLSPAERYGDRRWEQCYRDRRGSNSEGSGVPVLQLLYQPSSWMSIKAVGPSWRPPLNRLAIPEKSCS
jgi:hypothetical protein